MASNSTISSPSLEPKIHPSRLAVAVDDVYDPLCLRSLDSFLACPTASIQIASFLIGLIQNKQTNTTLSVYAEDDFYSIFSEMIAAPDENGQRKVDLYPFPLALTDETWSYEYTAATEWMPYLMYASSRALTTSMYQSPIRFLTSPFRWNTWLAFIVSLAATASIAFFFRRFRTFSLSFMLNQFSLFAVFFLFAVYTSNLKALLAQPKPLDPFVDLRDLAEQISRGKRRLVLEEEHTRRWRLLADTNLSKPLEFRILSRVVERKPDSLVIAFNQSDLCRMLDEESDLVFFAYDDLVQTLCSESCLWQYRVTEYPVITKAIPIVNMSKISSKMDVLLLGVQSYKEVLLNRLYKPRCGPSGSGPNFIGMESFYGPIMLWVLGLGFGMISFCAEITKWKLK